MQKKKHKVTKQVNRVKKDGRLTKNSDLTLDKEKLTIEETSASFVDQIVLNGDHNSKNIAEQKLSSAGGQDDLKVTGSEGTSLTGGQTGLTGHARNFGRTQSVSPRRKVMKKKPTF